MSMISFIFFGLVALTLLLLFIINKCVKNADNSVLASNLVLLISSYVFVIYADWRFAIVLAFLSLITWFAGESTKKLAKICGIAIAVLMLAYFKYAGFFVESFSAAFKIGNSKTLSIIMPLGISFYTFSAISYILDVSRGKIEGRSLIEIALYLSFFPKLTSGPIQKSKDFFSQIEKRRNIGVNTFMPGIQIFLFGLFKKIVLADRLSVFVDQVYETPLTFGSLTVFLAAVAYSFQIYFDFSGYSDMAVGVAKIIGIDLPQNFNLPYLAHNVTEFWKRWHITLSNWLQDYLYISLGGNRKGKKRTYVNLILTMLIGGIWHGAGLTFIIWGLLHGIALAVHKLWMEKTGSDKKEHSAFSNSISALLTFLFVTFCWIFFRAESVSQAFMIISRIFSFEIGLEQPYFWLFVSLAIFAVACLLAYRNGKTTGSLNSYKKKNICKITAYYPLTDLTTFHGLVLFFTFCGLILCLAYTGGSPFIYGKF